MTVPWRIERTNSSAWSGGAWYFGERYIAPILGDEEHEPDWVFRLTPGVGARLVPLSALLFVAALVAYGALLSALSRDAPLPPLLVLVAVFVGVLVVHEGLHGLGFIIFGGHPKFGFAVRGGVPYAFATCPGHFFTRSQFLVIGALPLVVISLVALPLAAVPPLAVGALVAFALNTAGAAGDVWMLALVLQTPPGSRFVDPDGTSMAAFLPPGEAGRNPRGLNPKGFEWLVAWLVASLIVLFGITLGALQLALELNGGAGGRLQLGPVTIAEVSRSGGHVHGSFAILPMIVLSALVGLAVAPAWSAITGWRRRRR